MNRLGRFLVRGEAIGPALVLSAPLSFWGGVDVADGTIVDHTHPARGTGVAGRILVMPGGRGSSSSSSVLAELLRRGAGPLGLVLAEADPILAVGCLVAGLLYDVTCPIVVCPMSEIATGDHVHIGATKDGAARVDCQEAGSVAFSARPE